MSNGRKPPHVAFDLDPNPEPARTWPEYLAYRCARVFGMIFAGLLVVAAFAGLTVWFLQYGWLVPGVLSGCATVAAAVTLLAALITDGFNL